jgi:gliding motility-associated-like protein
MNYISNYLGSFALCAMMLIGFSSFDFAGDNASAYKAPMDDNCKMYVPNIFSPNDDGINDLFLPSTNCGVKDYQMKVFSRWGRLVFESKLLEDGWDGKVNGAQLPSDTYVYFIQFNYEDTESDTKEILKGEISIIR